MKRMLIRSREVRRESFVKALKEVLNVIGTERELQLVSESKNRLRAENSVKGAVHAMQKAKKKVEEKCAGIKKSKEK